MSKDNLSTNSEEDDLLDAALILDHSCNQILRALLEDKPLRFNELSNAIAKLSNYKMTNRVLSKHLKHLISKGLVKRTEESFQNVTYSLSDKFRKIMKLPKEDLMRFLDEKDLPLELRALDFDEREFYSNLSKEEIDEETDHDLHDVLSLNLWELKLSINYDLLFEENENDEAFWKFFANPTYRMHEKEAASKCRYSDEYKRLLFEKIDLLIDQLRNDRELLRKRRATGKRVRA
jgi:DNA-binding HxlR family transcriptional regulator